MSTVCSWFSILCLRETQKKKTVQHRIHPNRQAYDAIVVWKGKENQKAKQGGISFDVILKPASVESPKAPVQLSPRDVKKRELSQEQLENKLKKAEERRSLIEQERMEQLAKERQKAIEVVTKAQSENEQFSKKTQEKLRRSMEIRRENRETQIRALQERLREHSLKVQEIQKAGEEMVKEFEAKTEMKLSQKMETYEENRQNQLKGMLAKLQEHANHINEVCQASENRGPSTDDLQEQLVQKMENALKNREEQLRNLQERLAEHENRIKEVQRKKLISESETEK
ncbi:trichohyalin-like isoform X1 [Biomphalaria glabrata]|uniref:Golgin subfamily A member 6-like protein 25 isoform X1 n=2 Tax=Biomphalaria TaxID=6525 RepID=A0A2C9KBI0_BIOGL|nr:golgin subfamily A member 6-like protein 25 isoform X1 [Biomphalaria glabrata]XP_013075596.1 golgin subfamily A member 6-like protein 25 isoform X1 [Biomphalaria glabrata]XP_013075603.1 golgin subfamily A member 6-like protein 25 isoform X1 [Biomphalaria glabrata]XP_013075609.1 golgin subfamily A member 6-like protein 25 isoform X1 [Biomphalaria glabrata]XP_055885812.1 golgin subfamily A member 6-like protein 25 isoform X1 [Biomphalaria glabrata]KAK0052159.1 trichohyalin-like isoform X1 [Bi